LLLEPLRPTPQGQHKLQELGLGLRMLQELALELEQRMLLELEQRMSLEQEQEQELELA